MIDLLGPNSKRIYKEPELLVLFTQEGVLKMLIDSHCHLDRLDLEPYGGHLEEALQSAAHVGVNHMLCVCIDLDHFDDVLSLAKTHNNIDASIGLHPNERVSSGQEPTEDKLVHLAKDECIVAIGETGLDYYRTDPSDQDWQQARFRHHIRAAKRVKKPLIIHTRQAKADTLRILQEEGAEDVRGVMHCFTEDIETAQSAMDLGFYISFSGIVTFKNATSLQAVAKAIPLNRLLIETDSPYLAPVPLRGKPNEPAYLPYVAQCLSELKKVELKTIAEQTTRNYFELFHT